MQPVAAAAGLLPGESTAAPDPSRATGVQAPCRLPLIPLPHDVWHGRVLRRPLQPFPGSTQPSEVEVVVAAQEEETEPECSLFSVVRVPRVSRHAPSLPQSGLSSRVRLPYARSVP